jgi:hypothetical protein
MSRRFLAIVATLSGCVMLAVAAAPASARSATARSRRSPSGEVGQQPHIVNGQLSPRPAGGNLPQTFRSLAGAEAGVAWIGYVVPVRDRNRTSCCWSSADGTTHFSGTMTSGDVPCCGACRLEPAAQGSAAVPPTSGTATRPGPIQLEGAERMAVLFRIVDRQVERIRTYSEDCQLDAGGMPVHWLQDVRAADSVSLLASLIDAQPKSKSRVTNAALMAISQHAEPSAPRVIERLARAHAASGVRGEALFWLAQMAGEKVAGTITAAIENDPDTDVKRRAVFALSQLPKSEGVPLLIDVARRNANPAVRKQAMFWLGQSKDPRAIEFFAEILK